MSVAVAVLVGLAVLAAAAVPPRRGARLAPLRTGRRGSPRRSGGSRASPGEEPSDLAGLLHAVAAQLRAGVPPPVAWSRVLRAPGGTPVELSALADVLDDRTRPRRRRADVGRHARVRAVVAGAGVAAETGAPLADVLEELADAVAADAEQAGEITAALAGPRATARVLVLLPVLGLLVGAAMGARPWEVLTGGGLGTGLGLAGAALVVTGRVWVGALLRRASTP